MQRREFLLSGLSSVGAAAWCSPALAQSGSLLQLCRQAFTFAYPLVCMDLTRRIMCNGGDGLPPMSMNRFAHGRTFFDHRFHYIRCVNNDTLYSGAWIDVKAEPVVLSVPDALGRFYVGSLVNAWNDSLRSIGTRTNHGRPRDYLITGPGWVGEVPDGMEHIASPTRLLWMPLRICADGDDDLALAHRFQDQFQLQPLNRFLAPGRIPGAETAPPLPPVVKDSSLDPQIPADAQLFMMNAGEFYKQFCDLMVDNPPSPGDAPMLDRIATLGLKPGAGNELLKIAPKVQAALTASLRGAAARLLANRGKAKLTPNNQHWETLLNGANFGSDYDRRAYVTMTIGTGTMLPEDTLYPRTNVDSRGRPLVGTGHYEMTFPPGQLPPANQFWSVTAYRYPELLLSQNALNRYSLGNRTRLKAGADGSTTVYLQNTQPVEDRIPNWMPTPAGRFELVLRLYSPADAALSGQWKPPLVVSRA